MEEKKSRKKMNGFTDQMRKNPWMISTIILAVITVLLLVGGTPGGSVSGDDAGSNFVDFINSRGGEQIEFVSSDDFSSSLYEVTVLSKGEEVPVHITKDGEYFVQVISPISAEPSTPTEPQTQQPSDVPKSDKPKVELFVMTHCPYGTQAEKGFIPALKALGDNVDASVKFVHYFLHDPEYDETPVQICIREEQPDKFWSYLECFLEEGDTDACLTETGVDKTKLEDCKTNRYDDYYAADSALSEGYGVRGSPTLVINGVQSSAGRSPSAYLGGICDAFNTAPGECDQELDVANPSPGFGYETTGGAVTAAQC